MHHLAFGARDVEHIAGFYSHLFGLEELCRKCDAQGLLRSVWLRLGSGVLMVERTMLERPPVNGVDAGLFLIAFRVDAAMRAELENKLVALGHPVESRTEHTSYFRDPEGNRFAISHYPIAERVSG